MSDLTEFLLARIAEDEALAREALALTSIYAADSVKWHWQVAHSRGSRWTATSHDPARVLAECEAKRRIVELHSVRVERDWVNPTDGPAYEVNEHYCEICGWVPDSCDTVKALAAVYADHPDYREEWRP